MTNSSRMKPTVLVGCGNMGCAMLNGWLKSGASAADIHVIDPNPHAGMPNSVHHYNDPASFMAQNSRIGCLVLAVKPAGVVSVLANMKRALDVESAVVSIAAGVGVAQLAEACADTNPQIIRCMPNLPATIGQGALGFYADGLSSKTRADIDAMFSANGACFWLDDEQHMHGLTALSGSGPAYVLHVAEAMQAAGQQLGLAPDLAQKLAVQTLRGTANLLHESSFNATELRQQVTSPNGTTAAALDVLMDEGALSDLFAHAMEAAAARSAEIEAA